MQGSKLQRHDNTDTQHRSLSRSCPTPQHRTHAALTQSCPTPRHRSHAALLRSCPTPQHRAPTPRYSVRAQRRDTASTSIVSNAATPRT